MELFLREPTINDKDEVIKMCIELENVDDDVKFEGSKNLKIVLEKSYEDYLEEINNRKHIEDTNPNEVNQTSFILVDKDAHVYGALNIRHHLNDELLRYGGNIGYLIKPSERRKGYSILQLKYAIVIAKTQFEMDRAFITCRNSNFKSMRTILRCGGYSAGEDYIDEKNIPHTRFWIDL